MSNYNCKLCFKGFKQKCDFVKHINRKTPCSKIKEEIINDNKDDIIVENPNACCYCFKKFSNKDNRIKHEKTSNCLEKILLIDEEKIIIEEEKNKRLIAFEEENKLLKEEVEDLKLIISTMKSFNGTQTIHNSAHHNTHSNNNTNSNNITYNITINKYKNEDISYLTDVQKIQIVKKYFNSITSLIDEKHFNKEHPENSNVFTNNFQNGYSTYFNGISWVSTKNTTLIDELYENNLNDVIEMYEDVKDKLDENTKTIFGRFIEQKDDSCNVKLVRDNIKILLYDKREEVIKIKKMWNSQQLQHV